MSVLTCCRQSQFLKASKLVGGEFTDRLEYYANAWLPARDIVSAGLNNRKNVDSEGKIILFEAFAPWKEHLFELEKDLKVELSEQPIYVIYPDETGGQWRVQAVPVSPESFESRKALPEAWRGLRDAELSKVSGIDGGVFVHASGFIGGTCVRVLLSAVVLTLSVQATRPKTVHLPWQSLR